MVVVQLKDAIVAHTILFLVMLVLSGGFFREILVVVREMAVGIFIFCFSVVLNVVRWFPVQIPLGARPGLGTQPPYEAPGNLRVKIDQKQ